MENSLSIGIAVPANVKGGPEKATAIMAAAFAARGHHVSIFVPLFPWHYYFVSLGKSTPRWLRYVLPHLKSWIRDRRFSFQDLLPDGEAGQRITVKMVLRAASKRQLKDLDCLMIHAAAQVYEYRHRFPQDRQIYYLWHPEEQAHGHGDTFKMLRKDFRGSIVVPSPFTAKQLADHLTNLAIVPAPISPVFWEERQRLDAEAGRRDILLMWKDNEQGRVATEMMEALWKLRPNTTATVWCWGGTRAAAHSALPAANIVENLSERELCDLYLGHSLLFFPSTYEGFGMPPIEALACGCIPVLRPEVGAAELYARDGENSIHLNDDLANVSRIMVEILDDPQRLKTMRIAAPKSVLEFNPDTYGPRILEAAGVI